MVQRDVVRLAFFSVVDVVIILQTSSLVSPNGARPRVDDSNAANHRRPSRARAHRVRGAANAPFRRRPACVTSRIPLDERARRRR